MTPPDPRRTLGAKWPGVRIWVRWMPEHYARTVWADDGPFIELAPDLGPEQQAMSLAHELAHLELGRPCRSFCDTNEREAVAWTARYLIPDIEPLGRLLQRHDVVDTARRLGLPPEAVTDRLAAMTPAEVEAIAPLLEGGTDTTPGRLAASPRRFEAGTHPCKVRRPE